MRYGHSAQGNKIPRNGSVTLQVYERGVPVKELTMTYAMDSTGALNARQLTGNDSVSLYSTGLSSESARLDMLTVAY